MGKETDLIIKLRADTAALRKDLRKAKAQMRGFNKNMSKIGASIQSTMLAAFGGAAILQGIRMAIGHLADFELQMAKVAAISGATEQDLSKLTKNALELGRTTSFTAGEISGLQLELSKLGFETKSILDATEAIQELALVTGEDLAESAKSMAGTLRGFNLEAEESERVSNVMAESFSKSALTLEKFTVGTANSSAIANVMGVTLEQNTARLGALVDANIDASKAGTDLRKIYIDLNKQGISYETALELVARSSNKVATATKLVGIRAAGALVILSQQRDRVKELGRELADTTTEMGGMADKINNTLSIAFERLKSAVVGTVLEGSKFNKWLTKATDLATEFVQRQSETLQETRARNAIKDGADDWKAYAQNNAEATRFINFHKEKLLELKSALTSYELKLRLNGETLNKNTAAYSDLEVPFLRLKASMDGAEKVVETYNTQLEIQTELLKKEEEAARKAAAEIAKLNAQQSAGASVTGASMTTSGLPGVGGVLELPTITSEQMLSAVAENEKMMDLYIESWRRSANELSFINEGLQQTLAASFTGVFDSIGSALAGGGDSFKDGFSKFATIIGQGMQGVGSAMIAWGVAQEAFQKSLTSLNPFVAIAAGAALVAAGAAIKQSNSNMASSASGGGGGGSSRQGFQFDRSGQSIDVSGSFRVEGQDLVLALGEANRQNSRNVG